MLRIMMLLANARSDVMFAHYAVRRNIIHAVNITAEGNITCPQGQTSFSVNAPLRASRYIGAVFFIGNIINTPIIFVILYVWKIQMRYAY